MSMKGEESEMTYLNRALLSDPKADWHKVRHQTLKQAVSQSQRKKCDEQSESEYELYQQNRTM